jgi:hypothetical protein
VWVGLHSILWTVVAVLVGLVDVLDCWKAMLLGAWIGLTHALLQWMTTSVVVADGVLVSRSFGWVQRVPVEQIEVVQRVRFRRYSGVAVRLRDGEEVTLAAPLSSVLAPNPEFEEDLNRLCASIAFGDVLDDEDY